MQFRLSAVFYSLTAICVALGLVGISPPALGFPILFVLMPAAPAFWITGIIYGRGRKRAYFVGSCSAGAIPLFIAFYLCTWEIGNSLGRVFNQGFASSEFWAPAYMSSWIVVNFLLAFPWFAGLIGGVAGLIAFRFASKPDEAAN